MLLVWSLVGFVLAFGLFVYAFDHFMGSSDTEYITGAMAGVRNAEAAPPPEKQKRFGASAE